MALHWSVYPLNPPPPPPYQAVVRVVGSYGQPFYRVEMIMHQLMAKQHIPVSPAIVPPAQGSGAPCKIED